MSIIVSWAISFCNRPLACYIGTRLYVGDIPEHVSIIAVSAVHQFVNKVFS